ncbi:hypothetical protein OG259_24205 [Streptomyces sp. NBC_00250]|uniref:hypothetical protein n=1 Tax=Streptomyces sp. NBC_00250 TaxID=2903641 RepID=UPI002E2D2358|nr:hypothetical protein [Streptomyces sp. NBC_00250]
MLKNSLRAAALLALVAAVATPVAVAAPAPAEAPAPLSASAYGSAHASAEASASTLRSSLKGEGRMEYPETEEEVRFSVDARATYAAGSLPTRSWGTFRLSHSYPAKDGAPATTHWGEFKVDCLTTGGPTATVTGTLVRTNPGSPWQGVLDPHFRMGVSFLVPPKGDGPSRIGLSGGTLEGEPLLTKCMAPAADARVIEGGYTLRDHR